MTILRWDPYREMRAMRQMMNRMFEEPFRMMEPGMEEESRSMRVDLRETENEVMLEAALPGVKPENVDITVREDSINISGEIMSEHKEEERGQVYLQERYYGKFQRTIPLPAHVDSEKAEATFQDGILRVMLPKTEEQKARHIAIKSGSGKGRRKEIETK